MIFEYMTDDQINSAIAEEEEELEKVKQEIISLSGYKIATEHLLSSIETLAGDISEGYSELRHRKTKKDSD